MMDDTEVALVVAGRAVNAIKSYRGRTGATIPEAKALVDALVREHRLPDPWTKFNPPHRRP